MKALILVDVQYDFLPGGALAVPNGNQIISILNQIQEKFSLVLATQDWHPSAHGSFASGHAGKKPFDKGELAGMEQILWPDHCVQGQKGAEISKELNTLKVEAIFRKGTDPEIDSYSGFFDNGKKKSTGLADYLKGRGVTEVYLGGLAADFCVAFTALDAIEQGFKLNLIEDATRPIDEDGWEEMKRSIKEKGGKFITSADL